MTVAIETTNFIARAERPLTFFVFLPEDEVFTLEPFALLLFSRCGGVTLLCHCLEIENDTDVSLLLSC